MLNLCPRWVSDKHTAYQPINHRKQSKTFLLSLPFLYSFKVKWVYHMKLMEKVYIMNDFIDI